MDWVDSSSEKNGPKTGRESRPIRVAAFTRYGRSAASTRQRLLQYLPHLRRAGIAVDHHALLDAEYVQSLSTGERYPKRRIALAYWERMGQVLASGNADVVWVYAELFPFLPAVFERLVFRSGKPLVYDFDDAFFHQYDDNPQALVRRLLAGKLQPLMAGAAVCCCGNPYLKEYAAKFCANSLVLPTVVDTELYAPRQANPDGPLVVGWIGSPSTWCNVEPIVPVLAEIARKHGVRVRVIGAGKDAAKDAFPEMEMLEWTEATEVEEVRNMDIGIMPLLNRPFQRGKSGYKLVQYMACGLPVVASPVGVNREIVSHGVNGFLTETGAEWHDALTRLLSDSPLRVRMGRSGRAKAEAGYSLHSQAPRLAEVLRSAAKQG